MNSEFPPLVLRPPRIEARRPQKRFAPLPPEVVMRRALIAKQVQSKVAPVSQQIRNLTPEQRKAVFVKLEHDRPIQLSGTGLKAVSEPDAHVTLAIPRGEDLSKLEEKIVAFGSGELKKDQPPNAFVASLNDVAIGEPTDRLSDTMFDRYRSDIKKKLVVYEIELVSLQRGSKQQREELAAIRAELQSFLGLQGTIFEHEERGASCHAVVRTTGEQLRKLVEEPRWQTKIIGFDARPEFQTFSSINANFSIDTTEIVAPPDDAPTVCVLDSGVTPGNMFLAPVVREDLAKSFLSKRADDPYDGYGHGSAVASLAAYYLLRLAKGDRNEAKVFIASARILDENNQVEEWRLLSVVLRSVVETYAPLGIKIFNFSVANAEYKWSSDGRRTVHRRSWIARAIDQLSREFDVVFVVSTGNLVISDIEEPVRDGRYPRYLVSGDAPLLDPAQAALALTVGSTAQRPRVVGNAALLTAIASHHEPSPFTRCGPGVARETKPELVEPGGNLVFDADDRRVKENGGTNLPAASNQISPALAYTQGTSFAAARVSHRLALVERDLRQLLGGPPSAPLMKAFLVNSASRRERAGFDDREWLNTLGYGTADETRATDANQHSVVMYFEGSLPVNTVCYLAVPVPAALKDADDKIRMTVTVVHAPEVQRHGLEAYLGTTLRWKMFRGDTPSEVIVNAMSVDDDGGALGETGEDTPVEVKFVHGVNRRSRGTVQHDVAEWSRHSEAHSAHEYTLAIAAFEKWHRLNPPPVPFAVVVRLEDVGQTAEINLYAEVEASLVEIRL